jgi:hypothetical protein
MVDEAVEEQVRGLRAKEPWVRYDSIVIGPNLPNVPGWFPNFGAYAASDEVRFNDGSRTEGTAGAEYCNQSGDTEDWAQDIYRTAVEYIAPFGIEDVEQSSFDEAFGPTFWTQEMPRRCIATVSLADTDSILKVPPIMLPSNMGVSDATFGGAGSIFTVPGQTGGNDLKSGWTWPKPVKVPAKGKIIVSIRLGKPVRAFLQAVGIFAPSQKGVPMSVVGAGGIILNQIVPYPNWYTIRVSHWGPRYLQLRGARSS